MFSELFVKIYCEFHSIQPDITKAPRWVFLGKQIASSKLELITFNLKIFLGCGYIDHQIIFLVLFYVSFFFCPRHIKTFLFQKF